MAVYLYFGLSIRIFEVTVISVISVVKFLITCSVSEILKDKKKKEKDTSHLGCSKMYDVTTG